MNVFYLLRNKSKSTSELNEFNTIRNGKYCLVSIIFKMYFFLKKGVSDIVIQRKFIVKVLFDSCIVIQIHTMPQFNEVLTARGNSYSNI